MIQVVVRKVKPGQESTLRDWMAELQHRRDEVLETFAREGVRHEQVHLLDTSDGAVLIYAIEAADHDVAASAFRASTLPIDVQHKRIMGQVLAEPAGAQLLFDCRCDAERSACAPSDQP